MNKHFLCVLLCVALLAAVTLTVSGEELAENKLSISTAEELLAFAEACRLDSYSKGLLVTLEKDIDLTGYSFAPIPIFCGVFEGNGHSINGLSVTANGSVQGLFRYVTAEAIVRNLTVRGTVQPGGSKNSVGGIAGQNAGQILNCTFSGTVAGGEKVAGIAGVNTVTGIIENCHSIGKVSGSHFVGGVAGENLGVIRDSANHAAINTTPQQNSVQLPDINMDSLTNTEAANTATDIGGIAGISGGVIRSCVNFGDVGYRQMGYNIGGIAGTQSGYIVDCENRGHIQGRKEVGGIVGQMEPSVVIEYSEDTLQILKGQLAELSILVDRASGNVQSGTSYITGQIELLEDTVNTARDALESLRWNLEERPDLDASIAALNTLSDALNAMPGILRSITTATETLTTNLAKDLQAIAEQFDLMEETVNNASDTLGGSMTDVSDADTAEDFTGKVENCINYGTILADQNVGGIVGAMAFENDLDATNDMEQEGGSSLNLAAKIRAVVLSCENRGIVTGKKQNAGGIVGWQSLGLVKYAVNTGLLDCSAADYVGGIAGMSNGYLRKNFARCQINAASYVGGIAGSGKVVTDCVAQTIISGGTEKIGAILGYISRSDSLAEEEISGNRYLCVGKDLGAIDGISYQNAAEAISLEALLAMEEIPQVFRSVTIRFVFADGTVQEISLIPGMALDREQIPDVPKLDGCSGYWEGLGTADLTEILFDLTFKAAYTSHKTTIQSDKTRENGLPLFLLEGAFTDTAGVTLTESDATPALTGKEVLLEVWQLP